MRNYCAECGSMNPVWMWEDESLVSETEEIDPTIMVCTTCSEPGGFTELKTKEEELQ